MAPMSEQDKSPEKAIIQAVACRVRAKTIEECSMVAREFHWQLPLLKDADLNEASDAAACAVQEQIAEAIAALGKEKKCPPS